jgi:N-acyl homoserine lactone hydrolase
VALVAQLLDVSARLAAGGGRRTPRASRAAGHGDDLSLEQARPPQRLAGGMVHRSPELIPAASLSRVSVSAEIRPAQLPLPGGRPGATVRLHPLLTGEVRVPPGLLERPAGRFATLRGLGVGRSRRDWVWVPAPAFLVEHPGAGPILVDTGLHPSVAIDPAQSFGRLAARLSGFRVRPDQAVTAQLRARGVDPRDVALVVMTHLHTDHASGVSEFPQATFVLDGREWEVAIRRGGALRGYRTSQFDHGFDWWAVGFDGPEVESFAAFGQTLDLLGDGSIRLIATPGHTLGHQSVLLRLADREALLAGDAVYELRAIDGDVEPLFLQDHHLFWRSVREIRRYVERTPGALVIPGHDRDQWSTLEPVYG